MYRMSFQRRIYRIVAALTVFVMVIGHAFSIIPFFTHNGFSEVPTAEAAYYTPSVKNVGTEATIAAIGNITTNLPTYAAGDFLLLFVFWDRGDYTVPTISEWTLERHAESSNAQFYTGLTIYSLVATSSVTAPVVPVDLTPAGKVRTVIMSFNDAAGVDIDAGNSSTNLSATTFDAPSVTTTHYNDLVLNAVVHRQTDEMTAPNTEYFNSPQNGLPQASISGFVQAAPGATGAQTYTSSRMYRPSAITIALYGKEPTPGQFTGTVFSDQGLTAATGTSYTIKAAIGTSTVGVYSTTTESATGNFTFNFSTTSAPTSWNLASSSDQNPWNAVAFGNGRFVAVADTGTNLVMYSTDGASWTGVNPGISISPQDIVFANGRFDVVGSGTTRHMYSYDGITWYAGTLTSITNFLTYGEADGIYVAMNANGNAYYSYDLTTWTSVGDVATVNVTDLAYGEGKFRASLEAASFSTGRGISSNDGISWSTTSGLPSATGFDSVTYGNDNFVTVSEDGVTTKIYYSTDGSTWTAATAPGAGELNYDVVRYVNGYFVAVAAESAASTESIGLSADGIAWTQAVVPELNNWQDIVYGNGRMVAVSSDGTSRVMYAETGIGPDTPITFWVDGSSSMNATTYLMGAGNDRGAADVDLYKNTFVSRNATAEINLSVTDLSRSTFYDSSDDSDILYTTLVGTGSTTASTSMDFLVATGTTRLPRHLFVDAGFKNNASIYAASSTVYLTGTGTSTGTFTGTDAFNILKVSGSNVFTSNASTTDFYIESGGSFTAPAEFSLLGNYSNSGTFVHASGTVIFDSIVDIQTATGTLNGTSAFNDIVINNTSQSGTTSRSVIFGTALTSHGTVTLAANASVAFAAGATSTLQDITTLSTNLITDPTWIYSTATGTQAYVSVLGTTTIGYAFIRDINACGSTGGSITVLTSTDVGNNTCITFAKDALYFSGTLYSDEGTTQITGGETIKLMIATSTQTIFATTTDSGAGTFQFEVLATNLSSLLDYVVVWVDGNPSTVASLYYKTGATSTNVTNLNLYEDHVIVRGGEASVLDAVSPADLALYDSSDDSDLKYTAVTTGDTVLSVASGNELYIWNNTTFSAGGSVAINGNGGSGNDGSLEVAPGATFAMASGTLSVAGNFVLNSDTVFLPPSEGTYFIATSTGKIVVATSSITRSDLGALFFTGSGGSWTFNDHATATDMTLNAGTVTIASGKEFTVVRDYANGGGTLVNNGTLVVGPSYGFDYRFASLTAAESIAAQESAPRGLFVRPDGKKMYVIGNAGNEVNEFNLTVPWDIGYRSFVQASSTVGTGVNWDITFTPDGTTAFLAHVNPTVMYRYDLATPWDISTMDYTGTSYSFSEIVTAYAYRFSPDGLKFFAVDELKDLSTYSLSTPWDISTLTYVSKYHLAEDTDINAFEFNEDGTQMYMIGRINDTVYTYDLSDPWVVATSSISLNATTYYIGANIPLVRDMDISPDGRSMIVIDSTGPIATYALGGIDQTISGTLTGSGALGDVTQRSASTTVFANNASTTDLTILAGKIKAPSILSIAGNFANSGTFTANSGEVIFDGTAQQTVSGTHTGSSAFYNLSSTNTSQNGTTTPSVVFSVPIAVTNAFTLNPQTSVALSTSATSTFGSLDWQGTSSIVPVWVRSTSAGVQAPIDVSGSANVYFVNLQDSDACDSTGGGLTATSSVDNGNNSCWTFAAGGDPGSLTLANHTTGQVSNAFSFQDKTNESLFAFRLSSSQYPATTTDLVVSLMGIKKVSAGDFTNIRLYRDVNSDGVYDGGDVVLDATGVMAITGQTGTITFDADFALSAAADYIVVADWNAPQNGAYMTVDLYRSGITTIDEYGTQTVLGDVDSIQHIRGNSGGGGSGTREVGGDPPAGGGIQTSGGSSGGTIIDTNTGGDTIGNLPGYLTPTAQSGSWNSAANALDNTDGTYATTSSSAAHSYTDAGFSIPGTNQIVGVEVKMEVSGTTAAGSITVDLSWNGGSSWTSTKSTGTLTSTDAVVSLGGASDTWGRSWSVSDFSNANFVVRVTGAPSSNTVQIDAIQVRVYHQASGGGGGGGGEI